MGLTGVVDLGKLSPPERLELISQLWDSLQDKDLPLPAAQREELDRRLETLDDDMKTAKPWNVLRAEMKERYR